MPYPWPYVLIVSRGTLSSLRARILFCSQKHLQDSAWYAACTYIQTNLSHSHSSYTIIIYFSHINMPPRHSADTYKICHIHFCPRMLNHCDLFPSAQSLSHSSHSQPQVHHTYNYCDIALILHHCHILFFTQSRSPPVLLTQDIYSPTS